MTPQSRAGPLAEVPRAPGTFSFRTLVPVTWHGVYVLLRWMSVSLGVSLHKDKDLVSFAHR